MQIIHVFFTPSATKDFKKEVSEVFLIKNYTFGILFYIDFGCV